MKKSKIIIKVKELLVKFGAILFVFIIWLIFASPYFLKGLVPYSSTYQVNFFAPWSHYKQFWGPVKNNAMPDVHTQIYPWKKFTIDSYKENQIPFWNPYGFAGNPHLANFQSGVFSPFNLLFFVLPFIDAWSILILLQPLLAGIFMYMFVREIGVNRFGSLISSITFMFCGFMVVWMAYGTLSMAIAFLPLALFAIEKSFRTRYLRSLVLLSIALPLSFFSGHFQTSLYLVMFVFLFFIFKVFITKLYKRAIIVGLFFLFGMLISFPQLLPSIELYNHSVRSEIFLTKGEGIPYYYLINIFAPDFFGNPVTRNDWFGYYAEWASFMGIIPLTLAFFSLFLQKRRQSLFFFIAGLIALILAIDSPLQRFLGNLQIPVISTSTPSRIIVLFSFAFAVLAGLGFDTLQKDLKAKKAKKTITGILILMALFLIGVWSLILIGKVYPAEWLIVAKRNFILPTAFFAAGAFLIIMAMRKKIFLLFAILFLLFAISFDSLRFAQKWMPFDPREYVFPEASVINAIRNNIGNGRIFGNIGAEVSTYYKFPSVEGYDPLYIGRYGEFIRGASQGELLKGERSVVKLDRNGKFADRVLDLLGVSLIFHPIADTNQGWAYPVWKDKERFTLIYEDDKFQLFKNNFVLPRAFLFYDYKVISNDRETINTFYSEKFDFRTTLILEEKLDQAIGGGKGTADVILYSPHKIIVDVDSSAPALLFIADNYYPGWRASVNGKETKIYRADYTFRSVIVPKGESTVEFEYGLFF